MHYLISEISATHITTTNALLCLCAKKVLLLIINISKRTNFSCYHLFSLLIHTRRLSRIPLYPCTITEYNAVQVYKRKTVLYSLWFFFFNRLLQDVFIAGFPRASHLPAAFCQFPLLLLLPFHAFDKIILTNHFPSVNPQIQNPSDPDPLSVTVQSTDPASTGGTLKIP